MGQRIRAGRANEPYNFPSLSQWVDRFQPLTIETNLSLNDPIVSYTFPESAYRDLSATTSVVSEVMFFTALPPQPVIDAFADRDDVEGIYMASGNPHRVIVLINHESYQRQAMTELFERELKLLERFENFSMEVDFVPQLGRDPRDLMPHGAVKLYSRA